LQWISKDAPESYFDLDEKSLERLGLEERHGRIDDIQIEVVFPLQNKVVGMACSEAAAIADLCIAKIASGHKTSCV